MLVNGKGIFISVIMDKLEHPQAFSFDGNVSNSWKLWFKRFHFYLAAAEKGTNRDKIKVSILLKYSGRKGRKIYETFTFEPGDETK